MYNRYTCPLQSCRHLTLKLFTENHPPSAKVPDVADFKSACNSLIIGPTGLQSSDVVRFDLGSLLQGQTRTSKVISSYNLLIILGPRGLQCETILQDIMGWESSDVVRFDLGPLLQGQTRIAKVKSAYNLLIIGPRGWHCESQLIGNHGL